MFFVDLTVNGAMRSHVLNGCNLSRILIHVYAALFQRVTFAQPRSVRNDHVRLRICGVRQDPAA